MTLFADLRRRLLGIRHDLSFLGEFCLLMPFRVLNREHVLKLGFRLLAELIEIR